MKLQNSIQGCLLGTAVGDAIGGHRSSVFKGTKQAGGVCEGVYPIDTY